MEYKFFGQKIAYMDGDTELAAATFPLVEGRENLININSTYVDDSLQGQGVGGTMMIKIVELASENGWKILPTCPFATVWFKNHKDYQDVLVSSWGK